MRVFIYSAALALLATGALTACDTADGNAQAPGQAAQIKTDKTVVAKVNGTPIYFSDVAQVARLTGQLAPGETLERGGAVFDGLLPELVNQRLLSLKAQKSGLAKSDVANHRIAMASERILANISLEAYLKTAANEEAAKALYTEQIKLRQTGQEARASHILVATEAEAEAVAKRLKDGEDFAAVATDISIDRGTQTGGGDLGWFQADAMVASFFKAIFALETGEISEPFESEFGWHIAKLAGKRDAPAPSYESMEAEIKNYLTLREIDKYTKSLREDADIVMTEFDRPEGETGAGGDTASTDISVKE